MLAILGVIIGIGAVLVGNALEGGHLSSLIQPTAAMIVLGGTLGAVMVSSTMDEFITAIKMLPKAFLEKKANYDDLIKELIDIASTARKEGILALDKTISNINNEFLKTNLRYVVDGYDPKVLQEMMEERIFLEEEHGTAAAKVWLDAGGFAPTIGILGAVLGLIHVMSNLSDSSKLGAGIAVAFVATVYGVGSANLLFIPLANKLKKLAIREVTQMRLCYTAIMGIQAGLNPRIIEEKLYNVLGTHNKEEGAEGAQAKAA